MKRVAVAAWLVVMGFLFVTSVNAAEPSPTNSELTVKCETLEAFGARMKKVNGEGAELLPVLSAETIDGELMIFYFTKANEAVILKTKDHGKLACTLAVKGPVDIDLKNLFRNSREASDTE